MHLLSRGREDRVVGFLLWTEARPTHPAPRDTIVDRRSMAAAVNGAGIVGVVWSDILRKPGGWCRDVYFSASLDLAAYRAPEDDEFTASDVPGASAPKPRTPSCEAELAMRGSA